MTFELRPYTDADEPGWLRCRVLGFLDTLSRLGDRAGVDPRRPWVHEWYEACGFAKRYSYLHVYMQPDEAREEVSLRSEGLKPVLAFAHYTGDDPEGVRRRFRRVHDDVLFERPLLQG